jgi:5'-nucleotidase (lipoprotein e(P4) family)
MTIDHPNRRFFLGARALATAALLVMIGCAGAGTPTPATAPAPAASAASKDADLPDEVRWVADSAEYVAASYQAFAVATKRAEYFATQHARGTWAVALDCDETVISNIQHEIEMARAGTVYHDTSWDAWVARRAATAMPGAREFLDRVHELGGLVIFVTNRGEEEREDTAANLQAIGLPYDLLLLRGKGESRKEGRWDAVEAGTAGIPPTDIVMWVGDNIRDFPDLDQNLRQQPASSFVPFGDTYILLPNPLYGSWKD